MNEILAAITAFFTSILALFVPQAPVPAPIETPLTYAPASPATYPTASYQHAQLGYSIKYPQSSQVNDQTGNEVVVEENALHITPLTANLTLTSMLGLELLCPTKTKSTVSCQNTAVRPLTNPAGTVGFLIRRTKTIDGKTYPDTAYVFPNPTNPGQGVVLGVESPSKDNLQVLDNVAASFSYNK